MERRGMGWRGMMVGVVAAAVLGSCGLLGPQALYQTTDVSLSVSAGSLSRSRAISSTASPQNIAVITVSVVGEDKYGVYQDPLATATMIQSGGVWSVSIEDLPMGPTLTFRLEAYDAGGTKIYAGSSTRVLSGGETISIALTPFDDGVSIAFPVILSVSRPAEIAVSSTVGVTVGLRGSTNETLEVVLSGSGGSFTPSSATVPLTGTQGELEVDYTAPGTPGGATGYLQSVEVTNEQGNSVVTEFPTVVVYEVGAGTVVVGGYAPSVTGLSGQREGNNVVWTAAVSDDGPAGELSYLWSYGGGLSFGDASTNPALLQGYDETATGTITLTVTDGDGLSTTVSFQLPAGLFPDDVVQEPDAGPPLGELQKLIPDDGAADDYLGVSVSVSGDTAIVGAVGDDGLRGSGYVYRWNGSAWEQETKLTAGDAVAGDYFGWSASVSGDTVIVGTPYDDSSRGSAYVYRWNGSTWVQVVKLSADDGAADDAFGYSVSISGETAAVGAAADDTRRGSAYVYRWSGSAWVQEAKLSADDGVADDNFGWSVSVSGEIVVVGARSEENNRGSAYVYRRSGGAWVQEAKLTAGDGVTGDIFGHSASISGQTVIVGAYGDEGGRGSAYVYGWNGSTWAQVAKLTAGDGEASDYFGASVSISGDIAVVGAVGDESGRGSAYVYHWNGSSWMEELKLIAGDAVAGDYFGWSASVSDDTVIVGTPYGDSYRGAVYAIRLQ